MNLDAAELYFHAAEIVLIIVGMAIPAWINTIQLRRILRDFPPHRHTARGDIIFPDGYTPPPEQQLMNSAKAGR